MEFYIWIAAGIIIFVAWEFLSVRAQNELKIPLLPIFWAKRVILGTIVLYRYIMTAALWWLLSLLGVSDVSYIRTFPFVLLLLPILVGLFSIIVNQILTPEFAHKFARLKTVLYFVFYRFKTVVKNEILSREREANQQLLRSYPGDHLYLMFQTRSDRITNYRIAKEGFLDYEKLKRLHGIRRMRNVDVIGYSLLRFHGIEGLGKELAGFDPKGVEPVATSYKDKSLTDGDKTLSRKLLLRMTPDRLLFAAPIFRYVSLLLLVVFITSFIVDLIHPLFWSSMCFGSFGVYGSIEIRIREELL